MSRPPLLDMHSGEALRMWKEQVKWVLLWFTLSLLTCMHSAALILALQYNLIAVVSLPLLPYLLPSPLPDPYLTLVSPLPSLCYTCPATHLPSSCAHPCFTVATPLSCCYLAPAFLALLPFPCLAQKRPSSPLPYASLTPPLPCLISCHPAAVISVCAGRSTNCVLCTSAHLLAWASFLNFFISSS